MSDTFCGYTGRLLRVDLIGRTWSVEPIPSTVILPYLGGRGLTAKYCYEEIPPGTDPIGPGNKLIFAIGPLTGTRMPSSGRFAVGCRSPHSGAIIRSICGGGWGAMLKAAGYDVLLLEGTAPEWTYLSINDKGVTFHDARHLLGRLTEDAEAAIAEELGNPRVKTAVVGPAAEKGVTFACIQTERRSAARGGVGCVMGSKKVKGIAVYGTGRVRLFDQERFNQRMKDQSSDYEPGMTVAHLLKKQGVDLAMVAVWMDGELIPRAQYDKTLVPDKAYIQIVLMVAGG